MKLSGAVTMKGLYEIVHRDKVGKILDHLIIDNTVTNTGKAHIAGLYNNQVSSRFGYIAIGSSTTAATAANTTLAAEITSPSLKRVAATASRQTTTVSNDTGQLLHTFSSTATQAVSEVGVFDTPSSGGDMSSRSTFTTKNLTSGDTLQVTHKLIFA